MNAHLRPRLAVYMALEAGLILAFSYATFISGTYVGVFVVVPRLVSQALAAAVLGGWLASKLLPRWPWPVPHTWPATPLDRPLLAGLGVVGLAALLSTQPRLSLDNAALIFCYALLFWFCCERFRADWLARLALKCALIVAGSVCLFTVIEIAAWYTGWPDGPAWPALGLGLWPQLLPRVSSVGSANHLCGYLAPLVPVALASSLAGGNWPRRLVLWCLAGTMVVLVWVTQSRGGFIGLLAGLNVVIAGGWLQMGGRWPHLRLTWRRLVLAALVLAAVSAWIAFGRQWPGRDWAEGALSRLHPWLIALRIAVDHPLLGVGPGVFGLAFLRYRDVNLMYSQAHSLYLHTLASVGIAGLLAGAWLVVALAVAAWRRWRSDPDRASQWMRLGAAAGLVAFGVHGLFDALAFEFPGVFLIAVLLAAYVVRPISTPAVPGSRGRLPAVLATAAAALSLGVTLWSDYGLIAFDRAVSASQQGDWPATVRALQAASRREPSFDYYRVQLGLAYGQLSAGDPAALQDAIAAYRAGGVADDPYSLDHANFAWLLWQAADRPAALDEMQRAISLGERGAPDDYVNFAFMLEETGQLRAAQMAYAQAVALDPQLLELAFWDAGQPAARDRARLVEVALTLLPPATDQVMACRRGRFAGNLHHWEEARSWLQLARSLTPDDPQAWLDAAQLELDAGDPRQAVAMAGHVLAMVPLHQSAMVLQAKARLALGDLEAAAADLRILSFAPATFQTALLRGQLAEARGDFAAASRAYQAALESSFNPPALYAPMVWGRSALAADRVPFLLQPTQTRAMVECYLALGHLYARQGLTGAARQAYQNILHLDPGRVEALQGLERLP